MATTTRNWFPFRVLSSLLMKLLLLIVATVLASSNASSFNDANQIDPQKGDAADLPLVKSILDDLLYDENGKLATHYVLFPFDNEPQCGPEQWESIYGFEALPVADVALKAFFPERNTNSCEAVCVERGTDRSLVQAVMPQRRWQKSKSDFNFLDWFNSACKQVEICLLQYHSLESPVLIYWIPPDSNNENESNDHNDWVKQLELSYGESKTRCFSSYVGHEFVAVAGGRASDAIGQYEVIEKFRIEYITTRAIGTPPPYTMPSNLDAIVAKIETRLRDYWNWHYQVKRTFSTLGFEKGRLPDDIFASMGSFYYNNRQNKVLEEWDDSSVTVNWWESEVFMIQIPWGLKRLWQKSLLELVRAWAGVPLEQTSLYGVRQYESGCRLLTHIDRQETHAVSLIVNIAQGNLAEPWPVEVNDHADRLHEVLMQPGDIVYYESAKALHGRNKPLQGQGAFYVNLFTHYRPIGDPQWFQKDNPPGVPEPILEIQGQCRLETVRNASTNIGVGTDHELELTPTVQCDDPRLGPYVSPTFFQAFQAEDLIDWWRWTSPTSLFPETSMSSSYTVNNHYYYYNHSSAEDEFLEIDEGENLEEDEDELDGDADDDFDDGDGVEYEEESNDDSDARTQEF